MPSPNVRQLSRAELFRVFKNDDIVKLFEALLYAINNTLPSDVSGVQQALSDHIADAADAHQATAIGATPGGSRASNTVQGQLGDLDTAKQAADALLAAMAALVTAADRLIYTTGVDTVALTALTAFARTLLDDADAITARGTLGLGTMATQNANAVAITGGSVALASGSVGYAAGNGGTVAQATSKATAVTLDKMSGDVTLNAAALAAGAVVSFTLNNANIAAGDLVIAEHNSAGTSGGYDVTAQVLVAGQSLITVRNLTAGSLSEAIVVRFVVFKAATT